MKKIQKRFLMLLLFPLFCLGAVAQIEGGDRPNAKDNASDNIRGISDVVTDLSSTLGVDLFEEDIDNVVFSTTEFLCSSDFTGPNGPFWYILQLAMALAALFSIIVAASMGYKMMVKGEPFDVFKILKIMGIAVVMMCWYPNGNNRNSILDVLAFIPNCIGSYTHDLYEAEAQQVSGKYNELMPLLKKRDTGYQELKGKIEPAKEGTSQAGSGTNSDISAIKDPQINNTQAEASKADYLVSFTGTTIALDKIIMFLSLVIFRVGWWSTIFCQQILLGMLTIFGPIQWAFSVLPKWEGAWAKWIIRYLTVHFYGAMLFFVGFYVLLLFDIVLSVQVENLKGMVDGAGGITAYAHNAFISCGYLLAASLVALKCLNLVPDLAAWMIPEGDTAFSTRNFGEGVASSVKASALSVMPRIGR